MISVIIVNHNGEKLLSRCLQCLLKQTFSDFEIILVDNASKDKSVELIRKEFPMVKLIEHPVNSGFSGGNIIGLKEAKGEYIALLNTDAFPVPDWLFHLREGMNLDPQIGICASKLIIDGTDLIDSAGDGCTTASKGYKRGEMESARLYDRREFVFGACGGAVLYRRAMIDDIGFFDEDFFLIHEDTDLNFRAHLAGWKCLFIPQAVVHHRVRSTIGQHSDIAIYYSNRNPDLVWIKNTPIRLMLRYLHHKIISDLGSFIFFGIRKRRLRLFLKAKWDALKLFPLMLNKRKEILARRKLSDQELVPLLTSIWSKGYFQTRMRRVMKG